MRAERQASSCASAPQPAKLNPTPAVILSLGPRLARRFPRSLHLHPYNCALLHRCMPPCLARVLLLSPPRFLFDLQTPDRLALLKHTRSRAPACLHLTSIDTLRLRTTNRHNGLLYLLRPVLHKGRTSRTTHPNSFVSGLVVPSINPSMLTIDQQTQMSSLSNALHVTCPSLEGSLSSSTCCHAVHTNRSNRDLLQRHYTVHGRDANQQEIPAVNGMIPKSAGRTPIACSNCAKTKTKCDKKFPCSRCAGRNLKCTLRPTRRSSKNATRMGLVVPP